MTSQRFTLQALSAACAALFSLGSAQAAGNIDIDPGTGGAVVIQQAVQVPSVSAASDTQKYVCATTNGTLQSCEGGAGPQGVQGEPGTPGTTRMQILYKSGQFAKGTGNIDIECPSSFIATNGWATYEKTTNWDLSTLKTAESYNKDIVNENSKMQSWHITADGGLYQYNYKAYVVCMQVEWLSPVVVP